MPEKQREPSFEFVQLLTSHQSRLYAYVLSLLGDRTQAEDVLQETNAVLWRKASEFQLGTNFGAWMLKVAYFQVMAHRRRLTRDRLIFDDDFLQDMAEGAEKQGERQGENQRRLGDCIGKLTERYQELIRRRYTDGATLKSIAAQSGQSENSIKQALFRARAALIECVKGDRQEEAV
ncbi:MAG: sigma-70 family RNA polymerase sigma factor [Planctomycetaceae bacterium]|nr:sigma-70 family RNA polymerase sigma factor [Planctomycetaceae bacterium]